MRQRGASTDFADHEAEKFQGCVASDGVRGIEDIEEKGSHQERGIDAGDVERGIAGEEAQVVRGIRVRSDSDGKELAGQ